MGSQISIGQFVEENYSEPCIKNSAIQISHFTHIEKNQIYRYLKPLTEQDYHFEKETVSYPQIRSFPYIRVKWNMKNFLMGLFITIFSNLIIAFANEAHGAQMPTYLLISSISNIAFNLAIFDWLFDIPLFRIFLVPLFPLFPLLIFVIATQVAPELQLFNYFWHSIHFFYVIHSIATKKYCAWRYIPFTVGFWVGYMCIITLVFPQMRFILLPLDQAITAVVVAGVIMTALLNKIQK